MKKLLYVVHSLNIGGTEVLVANLAKAFSSEYQVAILALDSKGTIALELEEDFPQIKIYCLQRKAGWRFSNFDNFFKIIKEFNPDLIHAHQYTPFFFSASSKLLYQTNAKIIFTEHGRHYPDSVSFLRKVFNQILFLTSSAVTAVCKFTAKSLKEKEKYFGKVQVIYNGIDLPNTTPLIDLREKYNLPKDAILVLYLGSFRNVKNPRFAVGAMGEVVKANPNVYLVMIGDGEQKELLLNLVETLKIEDNVFFLGEIRNHSSYWGNFNIFVQPSFSEAHSLALLEAMSHSLPVIVTEVGGAGESIKDGQNGYLVKSQNIEYFAKRILLLAKDKELCKKLGEAAKRDYQEKFRSDIMIKNYQDLYYKVLNA